MEEHKVRRPLPTHEEVPRTGRLSLKVPPTLTPPPPKLAVQGCLPHLGERQIPQYVLETRDEGVLEEEVPVGAGLLQKARRLEFHSGEGRVHPR